jgi:hypothetical protein
MMAAVDSIRGFRWTEFSPFFLIFFLEFVFLLLTTQMHRGWAMALVEPVAQWTGGGGSLHYPAFYGYLPVVTAWVETALYAVPGCFLIPLSLLRLLSRSDRALSLGAGAAGRLAVAVPPTLFAAILGVGAVWGWQRSIAPAIGKATRTALAGATGDLVLWCVVVVGGYLVISLLLYVPVAAVQARASLFGAVGRGVQFGLRALPITLTFALIFGIPAILIQFILERQTVLIITRLRPEAIPILLVFYAFFTSVSTYLTYAAAARLYRASRRGS